MNPVIETILKRRSVRKYEDKPVPRELLEQIVECGLYAATAMGVQPWHFTVVTDRKVLDRIAAANAAIAKADPNTPPMVMEQIENGTFDNFRGAPCAVLMSGENGKPFADVDCANAVENMAIAAESLGLNSCYLASFKPSLLGEAGANLRAELGIPEGYTPNLALAIGYGAESPVAKPRREGCVNWIEP